MILTGWFPQVEEGVPYRVVRIHDEFSFEKLDEWVEEELRDGDRICEAAGVTRTEGGRLPVQKVCSRIRRMRDALDSIATSYPVTDEGETLADIAREALK